MIAGKYQVTTQPEPEGRFPWRSGWRSYATSSEAITAARRLYGQRGAAAILFLTDADAAEPMGHRRAVIAAELARDALDRLWIDVTPAGSPVL